MTSGGRICLNLQLPAQAIGVTPWWFWGNALNRSRIATAICVPLTSNLVWADAPGNVLLSAKATNLPKDSVANVSQVVTIDRSLLTEHIGRLTPKLLEQVLNGIDIVLGR